MISRKKQPCSFSPDSTTANVSKVPNIAAGQSVLAHSSDGKFYLGTVAELNETRDRCLVVFGDDTRRWSSTRHVKPLPDRCQLSCARCHTAVSADSDWQRRAIRCLVCRLAFHLSCISDDAANTSELLGWCCAGCSQLPTSRVESRLAATENGVRTLSYRADMLVWSSDHKVNRDHTYCYCGGPGDWFNRMLQCVRCRQWFHEACLHCLHAPLVPGDRFYVLVCAVCNSSGGEVLRRLDVDWLEVVHLALFSLTVDCRRRFHDVDDDIVPWIDEHWRHLQLPPRVSATSRQARRAHIMAVLSNVRHKSRFLSGRENKKRPGLWCLRVRAPPSAPVVKLPFINDDSTQLSDVDLGKLLSTDLNVRRSHVECSLSPVMTEDCVPSPLSSPTASAAIVKKRRANSLPSAVTMNQTCRRGVARQLRRKNGRSESRPCGRLLRDRSSLNPVIPPAPGSSSTPLQAVTNRLDARFCGTSSAETRANGRTHVGLISVGDTSSDEATVTPVMSLLALIPPSTSNPFLSDNRRAVITRQLCEKDICIGKNGEVRRKRRRPGSSVVRRCLPDRWCSLSPSTGAYSSPALLKAAPSIAASFGAKLSSKSGVSVLARRVTLDGTEQYLVQWPS